MASSRPNLNLDPPIIEPAAIYGDEGPIRLRIATGGAGQTGLLKAICDAFLDHAATSLPSFQAQPFKIAWIATDTSLSFNALATRSADISITYHPYASLIADAQDIVDIRRYVWRDAFALAGPKSNPANLPQDSKLSIYELFTLIFRAAVETATSSTPVRFLSRFDKSANNILESRIWTTIGQTPWSEAFSTWYHRYNAFPVPAMKAAAALEEYTLVDRGTWFSADSRLREQLVLFKLGSVDGGYDSALQTFEHGEGYRLNDDGLGNPAHCLLGKHARYKEEGRMFMDWLVKEDGGRKIISDLVVEGVQVYGLPPLSSTARNRSQQDPITDNN